LLLYNVSCFAYIEQTEEVMASKTAEALAMRQAIILTKDEGSKL
jgi:hypothetical protein